MASNHVDMSKSDLSAFATLTPHETNEEAPGSPTPSDQGSMHSSSEGSETSTLKYDQEPYNLFKVRVENLCHVLWPLRKSVGSFWVNSKIAKIMRANTFLRLFAPSQEAPLIERLGGGDYNRVVGITFPPSKWGKHPKLDLILRVPRWDQGQTERVVTTLDYLSRKSFIPVPDVVAKDFGKENPLGSPYVIQNRIPGSDLEMLWNDFSHAQRCMIAREVGFAVRSLLALESPVAGYIDTSVRGTPITERHTVIPFDLKSTDGDLFVEPEQHDAGAVGVPRQSESTLGFFKTQIGRWRAVDVARNAPTVDETVDLWDGMLKVIEEMDDLGLFKSDKHCLCHVDLYPRNIMAEIQSDTSIRITGILDWDEAVVAPKFVSCEPPAWLWGFDDDQLPQHDCPAWPYEMPGANDVPGTWENRVLKRIFEESAGPEYVSMAYEEHFRLCRGLFRVALFGLTSNENYEAAERIVEDWARLRRDMAQ